MVLDSKNVSSNTHQTVEESSLQEEGLDGDAVLVNVLSAARKSPSDRGELVSHLGDGGQLHGPGPVEAVLALQSRQLFERSIPEAIVPPHQHGPDRLGGDERGGATVDEEGFEVATSHRRFCAAAPSASQDHPAHVRHERPRRSPLTSFCWTQKILYDTASWQITYAIGTSSPRNLRFLSRSSPPSPPAAADDVKLNPARIPAISSGTNSSKATPPTPSRQPMMRLGSTLQDLPEGPAEVVDRNRLNPLLFQALLFLLLLLVRC
jgi:hypothetical protein